MIYKKSMKLRLSRLVVQFLIYVLALLWLVPIIVMILTAFRSNNEIMMNGFFSFPKTLTLDNFFAAWQSGGLSKFLPNSFIITTPSVIAALFLSSLAGYSLSRFSFPGDKLILFTFVAGMMLPHQILLLPVFKLADTLKIYNTYWALIIFHASFQLGFGTFVLRNYMRTVPREILEAARVDGCGEFRIYWRIMLPLVLPALGALAILLFTWIFNDFIWALVLLQRSDLMPVTAGLSSLRGSFVSNWPVLISGVLIGTLPTVLVFISLQRYFKAGLTMGSTKG